MNDRTAATAARFGISEQCAALQRDLLTLPGAVKVEFDLDGFYDHMEQVILLVKFDVAYRNYFRVAHGFVYLDNDLDGHERDLLCELYDWDAETINSPDFNAILAETIFETSAPEYDTDAEFSTYTDASQALGRLIGVDVSAII